MIGQRVKFTIKHHSWSELDDYDGQIATTVGEGDGEGVTVRFDSGFRSYAYNDELEAVSS